MGIVVVVNHALTLTCTNAHTHIHSHEPVHLGNALECDTSQGEVYVGGSQGTDYAACKKSCIDAKACQSITHYLDGWCSHFSTACSNTKDTNKAISMKLSAITSSTTLKTEAPKTTGRSQLCS